MTKLKKILAERDITQRELHQMIKNKCHTPVGLDRICNIANGKVNNYSLFTLLKICYALDCTPNDLIDKGDFLDEECK